MIVEDDIAAGVVLARMLEDAGYLAICAGSCESARSILANCRFDLIITNAFLPGMCGLALIELIRQRELGIPTIAMFSETRYGALDLAALAQRLGAGAVLQKPLARNDVIAAVARVLKLDPADSGAAVSARASFGHAPARAA